jgi:hypothetical protein
MSEMIEEEDAVIMDESLTKLPDLLLDSGITLKQKNGYKAGKLSRTRNWCQIIDRGVKSRVCSPNAVGQAKTWKLFARFDSGRPPVWPWDRPERGEHRKTQLTISGNDVWGITYQDIREWAKRASGKEILERLASDLKVSFDYSRQRYC